MPKSIRSPELRAQLRPDYAMGCKRILLSSDYLPALVQANVQVINQAITRVSPQTIHTSDGGGTRAMC